MSVEEAFEGKVDKAVRAVEAWAAMVALRAMDRRVVKRRAATAVAVMVAEVIGVAAMVALRAVYRRMVKRGVATAVAAMVAEVMGVAVIGVVRRVVVMVVTMVVVDI